MFFSLFSSCSLAAVCWCVFFLFFFFTRVCFIFSDTQKFYSHSPKWASTARFCEMRNSSPSAVRLRSLAWWDRDWVSPFVWCALFHYCCFLRLSTCPSTRTSLLLVFRSDAKQKISSRWKSCYLCTFLTRLHLIAIVGNVIDWLAVNLRFVRGFWLTFD